MTIEPVNGVAMTYQGSASGAASRAPEIKVETAAPETAARDAVTITTNPSGASVQKGGQDAAKQNEQIKRAVESINKSNPQTEAVFGIHEGTNRVTIKIVDKESKEVIKEYPPEETLDMIEKIWEMAGILVDEKR